MTGAERERVARWATCELAKRDVAEIDRLVDLGLSFGQARRAVEGGWSDDRIADLAMGNRRETGDDGG